jgi:hypothetical protein
LAGSCKLGNEPSGSEKGEKFLEQLSNYKFVKMGASTVLLFPVVTDTGSFRHGRCQFGVSW